MKLKTESKDNKEVNTEKNKYGILIALNTLEANKSWLPDIAGILFDETCRDVLDIEHILNGEDNQFSSCKT